MPNLYYCKKCKKYFWVHELQKPDICPFDDCDSIEFQWAINPFIIFGA